MDQPVWSLLKMVRQCRIKGIFLLIFLIPVSAGTISSPEFVNQTDHHFVLGELCFHGVGELVSLCCSLAIAAEGSPAFLHQSLEPK
jgi:hypothetical protein